MRAWMVRLVVFGGALGLGLVGGCQSQRGDAGPTSEAQAPIFNPCSQLTDDVLRKDGLDPTTKHTVTDPAEGPSSWRICAWNAMQAPYRIDVISTVHTQEESRSNPRLTGLRDVLIGPRRGLVYQNKTSSQGDSCYASFSAAQGMFNTTAYWLGEGSSPTDLCQIAVQYASRLEPDLPK